MNEVVPSGTFYCQWPSDFSKGGPGGPGVPHNTNMLRDRSLVPLSRQHQHALALCVRIERALRAGEADPVPWQAEIDRNYEQEIRFHFAAEEQVLFPAARRFPELVSMVDELIDEHRRLRESFARAKARAIEASELGEFAKLFSGHIRKEERHLFEALQKLLSPEELAAMGEALERALQAAVRACGLNTSSSGTKTLS